MTINREKIMVAGGTGFIGKRVVKRLKEKNVPFVTTSRSLGTDLRDFSQTENFFKKEQPTILINCAAFIGGIKFGLEHEGEIFYDNSLINLNLFECARKFGVKRIVNPIANCSYPDVTDKDFDEEEWWNGPLNRTVMIYGFVKKGTWVMSAAYKKQYGLDVINFIVPNVYGPGDHFDEVRSHALGALVMKFIRAKEDNLPEVIVWGSGKPIREWLYVDDCVEAFMRSLLISPVEEPINLGQGKGVSIADLAEAIKKYIGYQGKIIFDISKPDGAAYKIMKVDRLKKIFSWTPSTSLDEGLKRTVDWYSFDRLKKILDNIPQNKLDPRLKKAIDQYCKKVLI